MTNEMKPLSAMEIATVCDSPSKLLAMAIANQTPPETLAKLMDLQERWEANRARKEYVAAMSEFKRVAPPAILKLSKVDFTSQRGRTNYNYANLGDVVQQVTPLLAKHGLHAAWETATPKDGPISVTCHITHAGGHRESVVLTGPADTSGNKNAIQAIGSCVTYLQRYTILAALGLATMEDDDGRGGPQNAANDSHVQDDPRPHASKPPQQAAPPENGKSDVVALFAAIDNATKSADLYNLRNGPAAGNSQAIERINTKLAQVISGVIGKAASDEKICQLLDYWLKDQAFQHKAPATLILLAAVERASGTVAFDAIIEHAKVFAGFDEADRQQIIDACLQRTASGQEGTP